MGNFSSKITNRTIKYGENKLCINIINICILYILIYITYMNNKISILFFGDIMLGRYINSHSTFQDKLEYIKNNNFSEEALKQLYGDTLELFKNCDLLVGN